jgi:hypothetical protein
LVITRSPFFKEARACCSFFCRRDISKKKGTKMTSIMRIGMKLANGDPEGALPPAGGGVPSLAVPGVVVPAFGWTF